ncbi:MAG: esterase/lipase family protein [Desulfatibacillaceae bacterium]
MESHANMLPVPVGIRTDAQKEKRTAAKRLFEFIRCSVESGLAILNGLAGDAVDEMESHAAIPMQVVKGGRRVRTSRAGLAAAYPGASPRICVLVHGLCCTERVFLDGATGETFGTLMGRDFGYTPVYVRYNSGLAIEENGVKLAGMLNEVCRNWPVPVEEIMMVGHSMGGLVAKSACNSAALRGSRWLKNTKKVVMLGSPQLGAPLEKFVHVACSALDAVKTPWTKAIAEFLNLRSTGIKDLRHGFFRRRRKNEREAAAPPPEGVRFYTVGAGLSRHPDSVVNLVIGDGLVPPKSALFAKGGDFYLKPECEHVFYGMGHFKLARSRDVYHRLRAWMEDEAGFPPDPASARSIQKDLMVL